MTYSYKYHKNEMSDSEIYQQQVAIEESNCDCYFCKSAGIEPPAEGSYAEGVYYDGFGYTSKFRGMICDMHHNDNDWIEFRWLK